MTVSVVPRDHPAFRSIWTEPVIMCGQNSLNIFCLGIFLSVLAHFLLSEINNGALAQVIASLTGLLIMCGSAYYLSWAKRRGRPGRERASATTPQNTAVQGGE